MFLWSILFITVLFILPVLLLHKKILPHKYRFFTIDVVFLIVVSFIFIDGWTLKKLGLSFSTIPDYAYAYLLFALGGLSILLLFARWLFGIERFSTKGLLHFNPIFAVTSIIQEFIFRSFLLTYQLQIGMDFILAIVTNALLFMFMHIIYATDRKILIFIFLSGLFFATAYFFFPNFFLISLLHILFNHVVVVLFGVFRKENDRTKKADFKKVRSLIKKSL